MGERIFISYRRDGDSDSAGRLHAALAERLGEDRVFMDVEDIPPGSDFVAYIGKQIDAASVFLAVIGPGWVEFAPRLHNDGDFVHLEIIMAMAKPDLRVVPVMMGGAEMPRPAVLPADLEPFLRRSGPQLPHAGFGAALDALLEDLSLSRQSAPPEPAPRPGRRLLFAGLAGAALAVGGAVWAWTGLGTPDPAPTAGSLRVTGTASDHVAVTATPDRQPLGSGAHAVVLVSAGQNRIKVIRELNRLTGAKLATLKDLVDEAPQIAITGLDAPGAAALKAELTAGGAQAAVADLSAPGARVYQLAASMSQTAPDETRRALALQLRTRFDRTVTLPQTGRVVLDVSTDREALKAMAATFSEQPGIDSTEVRLLPVPARPLTLTR